MARAVVAYLIAQALAVVGWWVALASSDGVRSAFELDDERRRVLDAFIAGDVVLIVAGSLLGAWLVARRSKYAALVVAGVAGAGAYATLYLAAWVVGGGGGAVGLVPMAIMTVATAGAAASIR